MTLWFYDPKTNTVRFVEMDEDSPLVHAVRSVARPVSPGLWFATILEALRALGCGLPTIPEPPVAAALVYWNEHGEAAYFPLAFADASPEQTVELGHILHQLAQVMIEDPEAWEAVRVSGDDDDGEAEDDLG